MRPVAGMTGPEFADFERASLRHHVLMPRWREERAAMTGSGAVYPLALFNSAPTAITTCAGANGLEIRTLCGTPFDIHSRFPWPLV